MDKEFKKQAVIYYSLSGCTKKVASIISGIISADLIEIMPEKQYSTASAYTKGISQVLSNSKPSIKNNINISEYDRIYIATPVWCFSFMPLFNTLLDKYDFSGREIVLISTHGGNNGKTFENFKKSLPNSKIIGEKDFSKVNTIKNLEEEIKNFLDTIN